MIAAPPIEQATRLLIDDKETSGCLVVAKNDTVHRALSKQFAARTMENYPAVCLEPARA